jgi:signal transduction histidine kinase
LKISHKGLILVAVPLVFEIAFVVCLIQMLKTAEKEAAELAQSRAIVACSSELDKSIGYAGYALSSWKVTQSDRLVKRYDALVARSLKLCDRLTELSKNNDRLRQHAARIKDVTDRIISLTSNFRRPNDSAMLMLMNKGTYLAQLERAYEALYDETQALTDEEEKIQVGSSNSEIRSKVIIYALIDLAVVLNVALTIALAIYFSRSITKRLGILTENTQLLAQGNSLNAPVTGQDEIASLDRVFHSMAKDLRDTEQRKQDFVSMITHDLRTPLTSMRTVSTTLAEGADVRQDEEDRQRISVLERSLDRMINLVNDLLDMDKIEAGLLKLDFSILNFKQILESSLESVRHLAQRREIKIDADIRDAEVEVDRQRMEQVIINLLANAIKYSPHGSTVSIVAKTDSGWLTLRVADSGRGIPEQHLTQIFNRFKQVEHSDSSIQGGSGLGLSISKALVELHRGTIGVESMVGKGSTFWFRIPVRQSASRIVTNT